MNTNNFYEKTTEHIKQRIDYIQNKNYKSLEKILDHNIKNTEGFNQLTESEQQFMEKIFNCQRFSYKCKYGLINKDICELGGYPFRCYIDADEFRTWGGTVVRSSYLIDDDKINHEYIKNFFEKNKNAD